MVVDGLNNIYVTGTIDNNPNPSYYGTLKYNNNGDLKWHQEYHGTGNPDMNDIYDNAWGLALNSNGFVYVTGTAVFTMPSFKPPQYTRTEYVTLKYGPDGHPSGMLRYHDPFSDFSQALYIAVDADDHPIVTGQAKTGPSRQIVTIKYRP